MKASPPCPSCSACCIGLEVELTPALDDVPDDMVDFTPGYPVMRHRPDGSCIALVGGLCTIYERRPRECRDFERGTSDCKAWQLRVKRAVGGMVLA